MSGPVSYPRLVWGPLGPVSLVVHVITNASLIGSETAVTSDGSHVLRERGLSYCL